MARPAITWLTTDTHWNHEAMVTLCGRPADFGDQLLKNLRHALAEQDTLIHLGDVIFYKYPELKDMLDSVKGRKILLMGNHDRKTQNWYSRNGFSFVADMIVIGDIMFSHKPIQTLPTGVRLNVHGHWHNDEHHRRPDWYSESTHRLLSVEVTKYKPVKLEEFVA